MRLFYGCRWVKECEADVTCPIYASTVYLCICVFVFVFVFVYLHVGEPKPMRHNMSHLWIKSVSCPVTPAEVKSTLGRGADNNWWQTQEKQEEQVGHVTPNS